MSVSEDHTAAVVLVPPGTGSNLPVQLCVAGQCSAVGPGEPTFSYDPPFIDTAVASAYPTTGGTILSLTGSSFGPDGVGQVVTVDGNPCTVVGTPTHSSFSCILPPGSGTDIPVQIEVDGQLSNTRLIAYDPPAVSNIAGDGVCSTAGGCIVTINGVNFGSSGAEVYTAGGSIPWEVISQTDTQLVVNIPEGDGGAETFAVVQGPAGLSGGGQQSANFPYVYLPPEITLVDNQEGGTDGGILVTLIGDSFGFSGSITIGGVSCPTVPGEYDHTRVVCILPPGTGLDRPVQILVDGATSNVAPYDYAQPVITLTDPFELNTAGGLVTISGTDFGDSQGSGTLTIDGFECAPVQQWTSTTIVCQAAPSSGGTDIPITVTQDGATGRVSAPYLVGYKAPTLDAPVAPSGSTAGGDFLTLTGTNFGADGGVVTIDGVVMQVESYSDGSIVVVVPPGSGSDLEIIVTVNGQSSGALLFSYDPPVLETAVAASFPTAGGTLLTLTGDSFDTNGTVLIGGEECVPVSYTTDKIVCELPPGTGTQDVQLTTADGKVSNLLPITYAPPTITSIGPGGVEPTEGGSMISITGKNFGSAPSSSVTVGGLDCAVVTNTNTEITCVLQPLTGPTTLARGFGPVVVTTDGQASQGVTLGIIKPSLSALSSYTGSSAGGYTITVDGSSFGDSQTPFTVTVDGVTLPLEAVTARDHTQLEIVVPPGSGSVHIVVTLLGQVSNALVFTYDPPTVTSVTSDGPLSTSGNTLITINGDSLGTAGTIDVGGGDCVVVDWSASQIVCEAPLGTGIDNQVTVTNSIGEQVVAPDTVDYKAPTIGTIFPQPVSSDGGATLITIPGDSFGDSGTITVGGKPCIPTQSGYTDTQIVCVLPEGVGVDQPVVVTVDGQQSNVAPLDYAAPRIDAIDIAGGGQGGSTQGGYVVTLTGANFGPGPADSIDVFDPLTNTTTQCIVAKPSDYTTTSIRCVIAEGQGTVDFAVSVAGQTSPPSPYSYGAPMITSIVPGNGPTVGATKLTIIGENFGTSGTIYIDGKECLLTAGGAGYSHDRIECDVPAGEGFDLDIIVTTGAVFSTPALYDYNPPMVTAISDSPGPTAGNIMVTLTGTNFGTGNATISASIGGQPCTPIDSHTHYELVCTLPAGTGLDKDVVVVVNDQSSAINNPLFDYAAPFLTAVQGCTDTDPLTPDSVGCSKAGMTILTLTGSNFGSNASEISITVGGNPCPDVVVISDTEVTCNLPPGIGFDQPVTISVDEQPSNTDVALDYAGPEINTIVGGDFSAATVDGGDAITLTGSNFRPNGTAPVVYFGPPGTPIKDMLVCVVDDASTTDSQIVCVLPPGSGTDLVFVVDDSAGSISAESLNTVSYPVPSIKPGTITTLAAPSPVPSPSVTGSDSNGERVQFDVFNIGDDASLITVKYGPEGGPYDQECSQVVLTNYVNPLTTLQCRTAPGVGQNLHFVVTAFKTDTVEGTDTYSYPVPPSLLSIRGCDDQTDGSTINCPTSGVDPVTGTRVLLTITGTDFSSALRVTVGGVECPVSGPVNQTVAFCELPEGVGLGEPVVLSQAKLQSVPNYSLSYRAPFITDVSGCVTDNDPISSEDCTREGLHTITIAGSDFGAEGALVLVGGEPCTTVVHDLDNSHGLLTCDLPSGSELNLDVIIVQGGQLSTNSGSISYVQCPAGTFQDGDFDIICTSCPPGTFTDQIGERQCRACPSGTFADSEESSFCGICPRGTIGVLVSPSQGAVNCTDCAPGTYSSAGGQDVCESCGPGTYATGPAATSCTSCVAGKATALVGATTCDPCTNGTFATLSRTIECVQCAPGSFSGAEATGCTLCDAGQYQPSTGSSECLDCPLGSYTNTAGQPACLACDGGTFANATGLSECLACPAGQVSQKVAGVGASFCTECAPGKYQSVTRQTACIDCPPGRVAPESGASMCTACAAGTSQAAPGKRTCSNCTAGLFAASTGVAVCKACPVGTHTASTIGSQGCTACEEGKFGPVTGLVECAECPLGKSMPSTGQVICSDCKVGSFTNSTGSTQCQQCPAGSYAPGSGASTCDLCEVGTYGASDGSGFCKECESGKYSAEAGATECQSCAPGTFSANSGASECSNCTAGRFSSGDGCACQDCPVGRFSSEEGATECEVCPPGTFQSAPQATLCLNCTAGTITSGSGQAVCVVCPSGSYSNATGLSSCTLCDPGYFQASPSKTSCDPCPPGSAVGASGQASCTLCPPGSFSPSEASLACTVCLPGQYVAGSGNTGCFNCTGGAFSASSSSVSCTTCPVGTRQPNATSDACITCQPGTYQDSPGALTCEECPVGRAQAASGSIACDTCPLGRSASGTANTQCDPCRAGTFVPAAGAAACTACPRGKFITAGTVSCSACPVGTFAADPGATSCTACAAGTYQPFAGAMSCLDCVPGKFSIGGGATMCDDCPAGRYSSNLRTSACTVCPAGSSCLRGANAPVACPPGTFTPLPGQAICSACPVGFASALTGSTKCATCLPGTYTSRSQSTVCTNCTEGFFAAGSASIGCQPCSPGRFTGVQGATACSECAIGSFISTTAGSTCLLCLPGKYSSATGRSECADCPPGSYSNTTGASQCIDCELGRSIGVAGTTTCSECTPGRAVNALGQPKCVECESGRYANTTGTVVCPKCAPGTFSQLAPDVDPDDPSVALDAPSVGAKGCTFCPEGTFAAVEGQDRCLDCPVGRYINETGSTQCPACPPGSFQNATAQNFCFLCEPGRFQPGFGALFCKPCEAGSATNLFGQAGCADCDPGTFQQQTGQGACSPCPPGRSISLPGGTLCELCEEGKYSNTVGSLECTRCEPGKSQARLGETECAPCDPGRATPTDGSRVCNACEQGKYENRTGSFECVRCAIGSAQPSEAQTDCVACEPGRFAANEGLGICNACPEGRFGESGGAASCAACPAGRFQNREQQSECRECPAGFRSDSGQPECSVCLDGLIAPFPGTVDCIPCDDRSTPNFQKTACECNEGFYFPNDPESLERLASGEVEELTCQRCSDCMDCTQIGVEWLTLGALPGCYRPSNASYDFVPCLRRDHCAGGPAVSQDNGGSSPCAPNRGGLLCAHCVEGYREAVNGVCEPCPAKSDGVSWLLLVLLILAVLFVVWLQLFVILTAGRPLQQKALKQLERQHRQTEADQNMVRGTGLEDDLVTLDSPLKKKKFITITDRVKKVTNQQQVVEIDAEGNDTGEPFPLPPPPLPPINPPTSFGAAVPNLVPPTDIPQLPHKADAPTYHFDDSDDEAVVPEGGTYRDDDSDFDYLVDEEYMKDQVDEHQPPPPPPNFTYKLKIFLGFIQIVTNLGTGIDTSWPQTFKEFVALFDLLNFDFIMSMVTSADCVEGVDHYFTFTLIVCVPPVLFLLLFLIFMLPKICGCCCYRHDSASKRLIHWMSFWLLSLYCLFLVFPGVSSTVLRHYICKELDFGNRDVQHFLLTDLRVECFTDIWWLYSFIGIGLILIYPLGIPAFFFYHLYRKRNTLQLAQTRAQLGFLYYGYKKSFWYFELVDMFHKLLLTAGLAFLPRDYQLPVGMVVASLYTCVLLYCKPYIRNEDDVLHLIVQTEIVILIMTGYVVSEQESTTYSESEDRAVGLALIAVCCFVLLLFFFLVVTAVRRLWKARRELQYKRELEKLNKSNHNAKSASEEDSGVQVHHRWASFCARLPFFFFPFPCLFCLCSQNRV